MTNITAKMAHSKESVELMCITQYNTCLLYTSDAADE